MILIISQNKRTASAISDILYYMGILSLGITPKELAAEISPDYSAIIFANPEISPDAADFVKRLRKYAKDIPLISLSDSILDAKITSLFDLSLSEGIYSTTLVKELNKLCISKEKRCVGAYSLAGIDAGCDLPLPTFFDTPIPLTKSETMILRYLIRIYPRRANPKQILRHAFKSGKKPEPSSIRTHVSVMNKKFRQAFSRPLISTAEGGGYTVLTPEYLERKSECTL